MQSPFTRLERKYVSWLVVITFVMTAALALRPEFRLATRPYVEDSFYAFSCARNLALGNGMSADGTHLTNGVQPLIVLLYAPLFKLAGNDRWVGLQLSFLLTALINAASVYLIALFLARIRRSRQDENDKRLSAPVIAAFLWTFSYSIIVHTVNGLETGLYSMLILIAMLFYHDVSERNEKGIGTWIRFGVLLGLLILSRIDAVFFVGAFGLSEIIRKRAQGFKNAVIFGAVAVIVSSPWWIFNYRLFGSFMPISGQSESLFFDLAENLKRGFATIGDIASTFFYIPYYSLTAWQMWLWVVGTVGLTIYLARKFEFVRKIRREYSSPAYLPWVIASFCFFGYYTFKFSAPHFLPRYFHPIRIYWTIIVAVTLPILLESTATWRRQHRAISGSLLGLVLVAALGFNGARIVYNFTVGHASDLYQAGVWASQHKPELVGMEQSGTAGFVSENVVNLDGKVNLDALRYRGENRIGEYIAKERLPYIADWAHISSRLAEEASKFGARYEILDSLDTIRVWKRMP